MSHAPESLRPLLSPRSVAVVGAGRTRGTIGGELFHNLIAHGFQGPVYPVNPNAPYVQSVTAYADIEEVPGPVDLAVLVVPRDLVLDCVEACGRKGVSALLVISAGFAETGATGRRLEEQVRDTARRLGMRMVGPNCLGIINTDPGVQLDATFASTWPLSGRISFSSQSGALGLTILDHATSLGLGFRHFVSVGNVADVSGIDLLEAWEEDAGTDVILLYLESFGDPRRFIRAARRVGRSKPIVAVKSGRTRVGARAASSHTGALAGSEAAVEALFRQTGVIRTDTIEELFDTAMLLANQPVPRGGRVAILTNAGGPGIMATDACESRGLELPTLSDETVAGLREFLPGEASLSNPVDMIASATAEDYRRAVTLVLDDPGVDSLLVICVPPLPSDALKVAVGIRKGLDASTSAHEKTLLACFMGTRGIHESLDSLRAGHVPSYAFPEAAAMALARVVDYGRWRGRPVDEPPELEVDRQRAAAALEASASRGSRGWADPQAVEEVLAAYGIRTPRMSRAGDPEEAARAASGMRFPVAVKVASSTLSHKTEVGGVHLDLRDPDQVAAACRSIRTSLEERGLADRMEGVTVQEMVPEGVEVIAGFTTDPRFGRLVVYGLGGVLVEALEDVAWGIAPLSRTDAEEMVDLVRGSVLLKGWRGAPKADRGALLDLLLRVSRLAMDLPQVGEMDLNPVRVLPEGAGAVAVDARLRLDAGGG